MKELSQEEITAFIKELTKFAKKNKTFSQTDLMEPFLSQVKNSVVTKLLDLDTAFDVITKMIEPDFKQNLKDFIDKHCKDVIEINDNGEYTSKE